MKSGFDLIGDPITTGPLHALKHEHRTIERVLRALDGVCLRLEWGEMIDQKVLRQIVDFVSNYADRFHHGKEELCLFPALERQGIDRENGPIEMLEGEHSVERTLVAGLRQSIDRYDHGDAAAVRVFIDSARAYSDMLSGHIHKEDSILFRIAEDLLENEDIEALSRAFEHAAQEIGLERLENYSKLARELERDWAV
jgi:hemerythrin-like domain-containing protein